MKTCKTSICFFILSILINACNGCDQKEISPINELISEDTAPSWSPDGKWIAYNHFNYDLDDTENLSGLYLVDVNGQNKTLLVEGNARNPNWSPDGEKLVFTDAQDVFTFDVTQNRLTQLTTLTGNRSFFPDWAPDGKRIAFDTDYQDPKGAKVLWLINADGTNLKDISLHGTGEWRSPDWAPDGKRLVHIRFIGVGAEEIFIMDTSNTDGKRLTINENNDRHPSWSPDGSHIAWTAFKDKIGIWLMAPDGSDQRFLTEGRFASWSPDSKQLVFSKETSDKFALFIINIDGTNLRQLTN